MSSFTANGFIGTITDMKYCIECNAPKSRKGEYCKSCSYKHRTRPSGLKYNIKVVNKGWIKKGQEPWHKGTKGLVVAWNKGLKGIHLNTETEFKKGDNLGKLNAKWKGDEVGYHALHNWVARHKDRVGMCSFCGIRGRTEFANMDYQYTRDITTWEELCKKCHSNYDRNNGWGLATYKFQELRHD